MSAFLFCRHWFPSGDKLAREAINDATLGLLLPLPTILLHSRLKPQINPWIQRSLQATKLRGAKRWVDGIGFCSEQECVDWQRRTVSSWKRNFLLACFFIALANKRQTYRSVSNQTAVSSFFLLRRGPRNQTTHKNPRRSGCFVKCYRAQMHKTILPSRALSCCCGQVVSMPS